MAFEKDTKGRSQYFVCWGYVIGWCCRQFDMAATLLGLAARRQLQMAVGGWDVTGGCLRRLQRSLQQMIPLIHNHLYSLQNVLSKLPEKTQSIITTDCKSLFDLISRHAPPSCGEFRTKLQAKLIKRTLAKWNPNQMGTITSTVGRCSDQDHGCCGIAWMPGPWSLQPTWWKPDPPCPFRL